MGLRSMLVACALGACSPFGGGAFECSLDTECSGGMCADGYCAFPDPNCMSGQRYGDLSGPRSGQCVGEQGTGSDGGADAPDMMMTSEDGASCYGTGLVRACFAAPPSGARTVDAAINTDTSNLCDTDARNSAWCVIAGSTISVQGTVLVTGSKPLVLLATQSIDVTGTLDAASHRGGTTGPAANAAGCNAGTPAGTSGGGAGGSFGARGGAGGGTAGSATNGGVSGNAITPTVAHGGCAGQNGNGGSAGVAGAGGGAVYLIAESTITIAGVINASGAGGTNGVMSASGGGGGGSGGLIGLDAPTVTNNGLIFANGGGGGEGSGQTTAGAPGGDPVAGAGGTGGGNLSTNGGNGGAGQGGATATPGDGGNGTATGGGGGGGGGVGVIRDDRGAISGGTVSPDPT